jgi:hypothetical protein
MDAQGLDGLLVFKIEDMDWLSGFNSDEFSIFGSMFIGTDGKLTHLAPRLILATPRIPLFVRT